MATLHLQLQGEPRGITIDAFVTAVTNWFKVVTDIDTAISGQPGGSLEWVVANLATGSLVVEAESHSKLPNQNYDTEVVRAAITGLRRLEEEGLTPQYLSPKGLKSAKQLLRLIGTQGIEGIRIANHAESVELTANAAGYVAELLPVRYTIIGSVEGRLEAISIHEKEPRCTVYRDFTNQAVTCLFPRDMLNEVKDGLGKRVVAMGEVDMNGRHEPVTVHLERLRILDNEEELPGIGDIGGTDPRFTGGIESSAYMRSMRDGE
jgi:hypothetical protein